MAKKAKSKKADKVENATTETVNEEEQEKESVSMQSDTQEETFEEGTEDSEEETENEEYVTDETESFESYNGDPADDPADLLMQKQIAEAAELEVSERKELEKEELEALKAEATDKGIGFHPNIGLAKLKERMEEAADHIEKIEMTRARKEEVRKVKKPTAEDSDDPNVLTDKQAAMKLVRCIVTCLDPNKVKLEGELFNISNSVAQVNMFVKFGKEIHIPQILYNTLQAKLYQGFSTRKDKWGREIKFSVELPAYNLRDLPALTSEQLQALKQRQLMAQQGQQLEQSPI